MKMHKRYRDKIKQNYVVLVKNIDPDVLVDFLLLKKALTKDEAKKIFTDRSNYKHNNRLLLFEILRKDDSVYTQFIEGLEPFGLKQLFLTSSSSLKTHTTTVFHEANNQCNEEEPLSLANLNINNTIESPDLSTRRNVQGENERKPLVVKVTLAKDFQETDCDNAYDTKSAKRGQVLIINNEHFQHHKKRRGSEFDLKCLKDMFNQMFMNVEDHQDLDKAQMEEVIQKFAKFDDDKISDICIVIIMSHGEERKKELVVLDKHNDGLAVSWIEDQFNNINCSLFSAKPKLFLYQFCRGTHYDYATTKIKDKQIKEDSKVLLTETDKSQNNGDLVETDSGPICQTERRLEDMLIGYATQRGRRAHRDPYLGSWYIQLICEIFMKKAHNTNVIEMLNEVDRRLKTYSSPEFTMQTSSYTSNGFNKLLYFNPGIYLDASGNVQKFV